MIRALLALLLVPALAFGFQDGDGRVYTGATFGNETITVGPYVQVTIPIKISLLDFPSSYNNIIS